MTQIEAQMDRADAVDAADASRCNSYGAPPGTPAYTQCRIQLAQMRQQAQAQQTALIGQAIQNNQTMAIQQQALQQQNLQNVVRPLPPPQTNCTTSYIGNQAYTHCQ
jgi:hypothetical protein